MPTESPRWQRWIQIIVPTNIQCCESSSALLRQSSSTPSSCLFSINLYQVSSDLQSLLVPEGWAGQLSTAQKACRLEWSKAQMWLWPTQVRQVSLAKCPWLLQLSSISKQVFSDCSDTSWLPPQCWHKRVVILLSHENFKPCLSMLANHT